MTTKVLLTVDYHTDTETGDVNVGDVDFGMHGTLDEYLKEYGRKGKEDVVKTLAFLIFEVERKYRGMDIPFKVEPAATGKMKKFPVPFPCDKCKSPMLPKNIIGEGSDILECMSCKHTRTMTEEDKKK